MAATESFAQMVNAARAEAQVAEDQLAAQGASAEDRRAATQALERAAVDVFTLFEARMQHHFRRGPFSRKLTAALRADGQADLADRVHQYYLAVNVLKHGKGASYRELVATPSPLFDIRPTEPGGDAPAPEAEGLVDVTGPGFFDGLTKAILEASTFLERR